MFAASVYYLGVTIVLLAIFIFIIIRTYSKKERERNEAPKYRMMEDEPELLSVQKNQEVPMSDDHNDYDGIRYREETKSPAIFRILFALLVVWGVFYMAYYLLGSWSSQGEFLQKKMAKQERIQAAQKIASQTPAAGAKKEGSSKDYIALGKKEYAERCSACHGADAKGGIGPNLTVSAYKYGKSPEAVKESIAEGRPSGMPGFKQDLSSEKMEALVQFVLSLK